MPLGRDFTPRSWAFANGNHSIMSRTAVPTGLLHGPGTAIVCSSPEGFSYSANELPAGEQRRVSRVYLYLYKKPAHQVRVEVLSHFQDKRVTNIYRSRQNNPQVRLQATLR
jgi:hypothetical protein